MLCDRSIKGSGVLPVCIATKKEKLKARGQNYRATEFPIFAMKINENYNCFYLKDASIRAKKSREIFLPGF